MELDYSPLVEKVDHKGWDKQTVDYVIKNKKRVYNIIKGVVRQTKALSYNDVDDLYSRLTKYLYDYEDYDIEKACERSGEAGSIISIEGYIHSCIKFCAKRFASEKGKDSSHFTDNVTKKNGEEEEHSVFDTISDKSSEEKFQQTFHNLDMLCEMYEHQRYVLGIDVFLIWFIRLKTMMCHKDYKNVLSTFGITKQDLATFEKESRHDDMMLSIAKSITFTGSYEEAVNILKKYVYSADKIAAAIENFT